MSKRSTITAWTRAAPNATANGETTFRFIMRPSGFLAAGCSPPTTTPDRRVKSLTVRRRDGCGTRRTSSCTTVIDGVACGRSFCTWAIKTNRLPSGKTSHPFESRRPIVEVLNSRRCRVTRRCRTTRYESRAPGSLRGDGRIIRAPTLPHLLLLGYRSLGLDPSTPPAPCTRRSSCSLRRSPRA
jgi:hypothetical protein